MATKPKTPPTRIIPFAAQIVTVPDDFEFPQWYYDLVARVLPGRS